LSDKKLQVLQNYLNDTLVKGWIQHFVSSAEVSIVHLKERR
jgi:hypothetical protein